MKKYLTIIGLLAFVIVVYYSQQPKTYKEMTKDGIQFSIEINQESYDLDDKLVVISRIENISKQTKLLTAHTDCEVGPKIDVSRELQYYYYINDLLQCSANYIEYTLEPGEIIERELRLKARKYLADPALYTFEERPSVNAIFDNRHMLSLPIAINIEKRNEYRFSSDKIDELIEGNETLVHWLTEKQLNYREVAPRDDYFATYYTFGADYLVLNHFLYEDYQYLVYLIDPDERQILEALHINSDKIEVIFQKGPSQQLRNELKDNLEKTYTVVFELYEGEELIYEVEVLGSFADNDLMYVQTDGATFLKMLDDQRFKRIYRYYLDHYRDELY
ncbi:hypothetical protein DS745_07865 [Anaerobacillus alkaliphilus]|uniref:Uncharacterized protein n=1 Tax=Anaerobacillus alkaliphilus TaxID=1548597 RepID=A0A4Q0VVD5_9BACI|nr:hypothetical protein [Anaerobacillus alkaliphilus]RXJ02296.1 hypothetical protein DS745_07865 [Anaerobacillus alkaliphilus]